VDITLSGSMLELYVIDKVLLGSILESIMWIYISTTVRQYAGLHDVYKLLPGSIPDYMMWIYELVTKRRMTKHRIKEGRKSKCRMTEGRK
jgi:hypothetical protein